MKNFSLFNLLLLTVFSLLLPFSAQSQAIIKDSSPERFFPAKDLMQIGVYYYPEQWSENQWERDFAKMQGMGFEFVHLGEFAWGLLEPEEGKFDFAWLDRAVALAAKHNLRVIICTPTPCPPAWMAEKYPQIFLVGADGRRREHGSRANNALADPNFRRLSERIIIELARHYGRNPAIWGWQLDNEPNSPLDYSPSAQAAFRVWLKKRYQTIETLNKEWGTAFWSLKYNNFEQIVPANPAFLYGVNPHAFLDFHRFIADQTGQFLNWQAALLRRDTLPTQWITTNYIAAITDSDPRRSTDLDFPSFTLYPVGGGQNLGENGFRLGWPDGMTFATSFYRRVKGATGVMELQPGQVNWAAINPQVMPGAVRMWLWHAFAGGSSFACTYRFRQPLAGSEQYHQGIIGTDGVTPSRGGLEYAQVAKEMRQLRAKYDPAAKIPDGYAARKTAILWNYENLWNINQQKQTALWDTWEHVFRYLEIAKSAGAPIDFIAEKDDFSRYPVLIAPAYELIDEELVGKLTKYAEQGGHLVLTCRTGQKKHNGQLWEAKWAAPINDLIGAEIPFFDLLLENGRGEVAMDSKTYAWNVWADVLKPNRETESWAQYSNQFYAGQSAVTHRQLGKGSVTYIGVQTKNGQLEAETVRRVYQKANIAIEHYPAGVYVEWRDGFWVAVNYSSDPVAIPLPKSAEIIIGSQTLKPADVLIWK